MRGKELIDSIIVHKNGEHQGLYDKPWWDTLETWVDQGYPRDPKTGSPENTTVYFDFDMEEVGGWFDLHPIEGFSELVAETDRWEITRNGSGASFKRWKNKSGTPEHIDFLMTSRDVWEKDYRGALKVTKSRILSEQNKVTLKNARDRGVWTFFGQSGLWEIMRASLGDICMFETLLTDPEWVLEFNRDYTDFYIGMYDLLFSETDLPDGIWLYDDLAYKNGPFCSPKVLEELFAPFYKEIADFIHSKGLPIVFHCCGQMETVLPIIVQCGYDALNPMERKAGCDPLKFAKKYGDRMAFIGGLNARTLESGDVDRIIRESDQLISGMKNIGAPFVFGSDHSVSSIVRYQDFKAMVDHFKEVR